MISLFTRPRFPVKYPCDDYKVACPDHQCIRRNAELMDPVIFPTLTPSEQASLCGPATFSESVFEALASRRNSLLVPFLTCLSRIHIYWIPSTSMKFHQSICALCSKADLMQTSPKPRFRPYLKMVLMLTHKLGPLLHEVATGQPQRSVPTAATFACRALEADNSWRVPAVGHLPGPHETCTGDKWPTYFDTPLETLDFISNILNIYIYICKIYFNITSTYFYHLRFGQWRSYPLVLNSVVSISPSSHVQNMEPKSLDVGKHMINCF